MRRSLKLKPLNFDAFSFALLKPLSCQAYKARISHLSLSPSDVQFDSPMLLDSSVWIPNTCTESDVSFIVFVAVSHDCDLSSFKRFGLESAAGSGCF